MSIVSPTVHDALESAGIDYREIPCEGEFADTAAFCEKYGFTLEQSANTIVVASRKVEPVKYAACVVLATHRLDVNKAVTRELSVKRASFADHETATSQTGMEYGGIVVVGVKDMPVLIDADVMKQPEVVMGGGNRTSKIVLNPQELLKLPNVKVVEGLAKKVEEV